MSAMPCSSAVAEPRRQATLSPLACSTKSSTLRAEAEHDVGIGAHRLQQRGLQVGAMDRPVGRAVAALGRFAEGRARQSAAARGLDGERLRHGNGGAQPLAEAERDQDAGGVGRELDAGAGFRKLTGLLQQSDAEA